ncbi:MAG: ZIP family metal transporter [Microscillaceae bacterium]|jgi:zinc and cadmium transporter|nr:ZIP family metal transporter [Microscillaceae bacterium]
MDLSIFYAFLGSLIVSLVSLVGVFVLYLKPQTLQKSLYFLVSLAVGVLLGDAFLHLLPDAIAQTQDVEGVMLFTLLGIVIFFFVEKILGWNHSHTLPSPQTNIKSLSKMNLVGDAIHNFVDGTLIASSFLISPWVGITTTLAIVAHEIPQEIGDVGTLIYGGYTPRKAILYNFYCSLTCLVGVGFIAVFHHWRILPLPYLMPIAAGGFIYIAGSDLIPELHQKNQLKASLGQGLMISLGISFMMMINAFEHFVP